MHDVLCNHSVHDFLVSIEDGNGGSSRCLSVDVNVDAGDINKNAEEFVDIVGTIECGLLCHTSNIWTGQPFVCPLSVAGA